MFNRKLFIASYLGLAAWTAFGQCTTATTSRYVMQVPPSNSLSSRFQGFSADGNCSGPVVDYQTAPTGVSQIVVKPDGTKYYALGSGGVQSISPSFSSFLSIGGIASPTTMAMSPDGRYLYVGATGLYVVDTVSDTVLPNSLANTGTVAGIVFSADSKSAYILTNSPLSAFLTQVDTSTRAQVGQTFSLPPGIGTITMSPQQLIYLTSGNTIYEINPATLSYTANGQIATSLATVGPLRFTPDGTAAYAVDQNPLASGCPVVQFSPSTHAVVPGCFVNVTTSLPPAFVDVYPASATRIFAIASNSTTIWDINPSSLNSSAPSTSLAPLGTFVLNNILTATISNEAPSARYLYLLVANGNQTNFYKVDLTTNTAVLTSLAFLGTGTLQFTSVPPQSGAVGFVQFNNNQVVAPGGTTAALSAVVTNSAGIPVYNVPVTYGANASSGITITGASTVTNGKGYVQAYATMPSTPGNYTVTLTAGSATASFSITVGTGPVGSSSQVSIVSGNGQLINKQNFNTPPLVVQVKDSQGNPLPNATVSFSIASGPGEVGSSTAVTDSQGLASTSFLPGIPASGLNFQASDVNASTAVGSVDFTETSYNAVTTDPGQPSFVLINPPTGTVIGGEGDVITDGVTVQVTSGLTPNGPIPGIGIRIASANDINKPGPATCAGNYLSDQNGIAHCNVQIGCTVGIGTSGFQVVVGEKTVFTVFLQVGPGTSQKLGVVSGNSQTGHSGQTLSPLVARVTDNCGNAVSGVQVGWKVTSGDATLSASNSVSDSMGNVSTKVTLGQTAGSVVVSASIGTGSQAAFTLTNNVSIQGPSLVSGGGQTVPFGQVSSPITFAVTDMNNKPLSGIQVNFSITQGSATLSAPSALTNSSGQASVTVTAGTTPGTVVVTASVASANQPTVTASLTVTPPAPVLTSASFTNAASAQPGLVACGLGAGTGAGIAPGISGVVPGGTLGLGPLPYSISGTSVSVGGLPAPLVSLSNVNGVQQVVFQTPCEVPPGANAVSVTVNGVTTTVPGVPVFGGQPGIFTYLGPKGQKYGAVIRALDGSYVTPNSLAHRGETYFIVTTGLGQTTPPAITNATGTGQSIPASQLIIGLNNSGVPVLSASYVAQGVYYVGFVIPSDAQTGTDLPLSLGEVIVGQTVYDNGGVLLPGVQ